MGDVIKSLREKSQKRKKLLAQTVRPFFFAFVWAFGPELEI